MANLKVRYKESTWWQFQCMAEHGSAVRPHWYEDGFETAAEAGDAARAHALEHHPVVTLRLIERTTWGTPKDSTYAMIPGVTHHVQVHPTTLTIDISVLREGSK